MALNVLDRQRLEGGLLRYVERHPGCRIEAEEIADVIDEMVDAGRLERWWSYGFAHFYIPGTHTPMPTSKNPEKQDKYIAAYLDAFDEFCDEVMERYDQEVIGELTPEAMISLYRGFLTALPDIERAGGRK